MYIIKIDFSKNFYIHFPEICKLINVFPVSVHGQRHEYSSVQPYRNEGHDHEPGY